MSVVKLGLRECRKQAGRPKDPWRGVNLGGFLLLEPGTALEPEKQRSIFDIPKKTGCEYDLMQTLVRDLDAEKAAERIRAHRKQYIDYLIEKGFKRMKSFGINAVRIPIPYWIVQGPEETHYSQDTQEEDPYVREPKALELYIDRAVEGARHEGLQVVLDLHAAPGGENDEAPSGRIWKYWTPDHWSREGSLRALDKLAERYGRSESFDNVTGIEVCNEPSDKVPTHDQYAFYKDAVETVRRHMKADRVTIILPNFKRGSLQNYVNYAKGWQIFSGGVYDNVIFDFHFYYCFGRWFQQKASLSDQFREVVNNGRLLASIPAVVGEWSLGLGGAALSGEFVEISSKEDAQARFKRLQIDTYSCASHGWFYWNWMDIGGDGTEWDFQKSFTPSALDSAKVLPAWDAQGKDPLDIQNGDHIVLRSFHGKCVSVTRHGSVQPTTWFKDDANSFKIVIVGPGPDGFHGGDSRDHGSPIRDGYVVQLQFSDGSGNRRFLAIDSADEVILKEPESVSDVTTNFIIHVPEENKLRHYGVIFLQSKKTFKLVVSEPKLMHAKWKEDYGEWQNFCIEKRFVSASSASCDHLTARTPVKVRKRGIQAISSAEDMNHT